MKKILVFLSVIALLAIGITAFAHNPGWGRGYTMGPGYGQMGMAYGPGYGYCGGPGSCFGVGGAFTQRFLDETVNLRRELNQKRFDFMEAIRNPKSDNKTIARLEKEMDQLQEKIYEKAPEGAYGLGYGIRGGYGCRW
jgi:hypothetical protein